MMSKINVALLKLLTTLGVGYFNKKLYLLKLDSSGNYSWELPQKGKMPNCVIVSREHYQESHTSYPVETRSEVKNLVALEQAESETNGATIHRIYAADNGKTSINSWLFDDVVPNAKLIIPESYFLSADLDFYQPIISSFSESLSYSTRTPNGVVSSLQGGLISDIESFAMASGVMLNQRLPAIRISREQHAEHIASKLIPFLFTDGKYFIYQDKTQNTGLEKNAVTMIGSALLIATLYLGLSSGYLLWKEQQLEQVIADNRYKVNNALSVQNRFTELANELALQQAFSSTQSVKTPFWQVVAPLFQHAKFRTLRYRNGRFVINGETSKATELLDIINSSPLVSDAKFDTAVRKSRNKEVFIISFVLVSPDATVPEESK
ncbi:hypothetical protein [Vibrio rotiferianus]|uniref:hypothetical protein n=1 Tax=Vibrio rotiferianus TaxID=190895 RepID=UPI0028938575|nr:conserved hypothetical protein [Vibrio rotiferianus]